MQKTKLAERRTSSDIKADYRNASFVANNRVIFNIKGNTYRLVTAVNYASTISRCKRVWEEEHRIWNQRNLENKKYVYIWADGVYFNIRSDDARPCILVIIGVTEHGRKEFIAIEDGYRESDQSWSELLLRIKAQGLRHPPKLAVGDGLER